MKELPIRQWTIEGDDGLYFTFNTGIKDSSSSRHLLIYTEIKPRSRFYIHYSSKFYIEPKTKSQLSIEEKRMIMKNLFVQGIKVIEK